MECELFYKYLRDVFLYEHSTILFEFYRIQTLIEFPPIMTRISDEFPDTTLINPQRSHLKTPPPSIHNHLL
jgi:hypothetical protein